MFYNLSPSGQIQIGVKPPAQDILAEMRGTMEQEIRLLCSGYGAEKGSDLLAVKLFENTDIKVGLLTGTLRESEKKQIRKSNRYN